MAKEIAKDIYRIEVPLEGSPLRVLNAYFFRGEDEDWLMDTGFNTQACEDALRKELENLDCRFETLNIINTHMHADHVGLDYAFIGEKGHIFMSRSDAEDAAFAYNGGFKARLERDRREGATEQQLEKMYSTRPGGAKIRQGGFPADKVKGLENHDRIRIGNRELEMLLMPGHTRGNSMFWLPEEKIMFTGDHILFDITPNITAWPQMKDALGEYLKSLELADSYDVAAAMPGHRAPGDYHGRIRALLQHHAERLEEVKGIIRENPGLTAYRITELMKWSVHRDPDGSFPIAQLRFAAGECMSHLDRLVISGQITKDEEGPVIRYYVN